MPDLEIVNVKNPEERHPTYQRDARGVVNEHQTTNLSRFR
jgi:hypothetical protein